MHAKLKPVKGCPCHKICTQGILLWQICSEVHLFPLVALLNVLISGETELSQMPTTDKIQLTSYNEDDNLCCCTFWLLIDGCRMTLLSQLNLFWIALQICTVVSD